MILKNLKKSSTNANIFNQNLIFGINKKIIIKRRTLTLMIYNNWK